MKRTRRQDPPPATSSRPAAPAAPHGLADGLVAPVDAASLLVFRRCFGALMVWQMLHYVVGGRLQRLYLDPAFHFTYQGFAWLPRLPDPALRTVAWALLGAAAAMALGWRPRTCGAIFGVLYGYLLLLDKANYNNHDYLIALVALALAAVPIDRRQAAPAWGLALLRFQIAMPYVFGGIAKLQADWLLRAQPLKIWFAQPAEHLMPTSWLAADWIPYAVAWAGAAIDLFLVPLLLWRRTRTPAVVVAILFHLLNAGMFLIGIFPWLMIAALGLYCEPGWPRRWGLLRGAAAPGRGAEPAAAKGRRLVLAALAAYAGLQLALPLRHLLYPGNVDWTEEGHTFAWRMKVRDKRGSARFVAVRPGSPAAAIPLDGLASALLTVRQEQMMLHDPEMMRQVAVHVAREWRTAGGGPVGVRALTDISLNGRPGQPLIDPGVDLAALPAGRPAREWIVPLAR